MAAVQQDRVNMALVGAIVSVATIGGLLFGYDSGAVNGTQAGLKEAFALDDKGLGFTVGSLLIGFFSNPEFFGGAWEEGIFFGGGAKLLFEQLLANLAAIVWSFAITFVLMIVLKKTVGVRVGEEQEATGLDLALHGETAYHSGGLG